MKYLPWFFITLGFVRKIPTSFSEVSSSQMKNMVICCINSNKFKMAKMQSNWKGPFCSVFTHQWYNQAENKVNESKMIYIF